jgi:hypothetical protein
LASDIADTIVAADFDEYDIDAGTNCFCGTFALALKKSFPEVEFGLIVLNDENGEPMIAKDGQFVWKHAVATVANRLFDIEGEVELSHLIENYCWKNPARTGGSLVKMAEEVFLAHIDDEKGSFDRSYYDKWLHRLAHAKELSDIHEARSPINAKF